MLLTKNNLRKITALFVATLLLVFSFPSFAFAKQQDRNGQITADWYNFRNSEVNMGITNTNTPKVPEDTVLRWNAKLGTGWAAAPSIQLIVDDALIVMCNKTLYKLNLEDGSVIAQVTMAQGAGFGYTPMTYADGMIFCPEQNGTIQAFDAKNLNALWTYQDELKGQSLSPIAYSEGYLYTGFWNGETKEANFVCVNTTDSDPTIPDETKEAVWKNKQLGGYYWAGSVVVGDYVIVGCDDGIGEAQPGTSYVTSFNKKTGEIVSKIDLTEMGDQRSSIAYDETSNRIFFTTKCGYLCSAAINKSNGIISGLKSVYCDAQSTSTPIVYKGYAYFGIGGLNKGGYFVVAKADTLEIVSKVQLINYPQCSFLLSTAYEEAEGLLYFYSTYNGSPGGISLIKVKVDNPASNELVEVYDAKGFEQYCITSIICDKSGNLYYKNDSGNVLSVGIASYASVKTLINNIGLVTENSGAAIEAARDAYNKLSDEDKTHVINYDTLTEAEKVFALIQEAKSQPATDIDIDSQDTRITTTGNLTIAANPNVNVSLSANMTLQGSDNYNKLASEVAKFEGSTLLNIFDVNLNVTLKSSGEAVLMHDSFGYLNIKFPIDQKYVGRKIRVHHLLENGNILQEQTTAQLGYVELKVDKLSSFAIEALPIGEEEPVANTETFTITTATGATHEISAPVDVEKSSALKNLLSSNDMEEESSQFPIIPVVVASIAIVFFGVAAVLRFKKKKD